MINLKFWLITALLMTGLPAMADPAVYQRIDFQADAEGEVTNDLLIAVLSIELNNKSPALLARDLTQKTNSALKQGAAFPGVKLTSGNQQTWPIYNDKNQQTGWRGRAEVKLESMDFKAAGELVSLLQNDLQLNNLNFAVSPKTRRDVENRLIDEAIQSFRQRADRIRSGWNAKSYKLVQMNLGTAGIAQPQPMVMMRAAKMGGEMDSAPAADYAGGQSRLSVQVNGTIELE